MIPNLRIRPLTAADIQGVFGLAASLRDAPHWPPESYLSALQPDSQPARIALIAEASGTLAGFVVASTIPPEAELESIAVAGKWQRRGVARALLAALCAELRSRGVTSLLLEVRAANAAARAFYQAAGFTEEGRRSRYYAQPPDDAVLLRRNFF